MQLGCGRTPFSRTADGRATLRGCVLEYVMSEALFHLRLFPAVRAVCLATTHEQLTRDWTLPAHTLLPGGLLCRAAPSFIRFGSFEHHSAARQTALVRRLADYSIAHHFPHIPTDSPDRYALFFASVCADTAKLVATWQVYGFIHGQKRGTTHV